MKNQKSKIKNQNERLKIKKFLVLVLILLSTSVFADEVEQDDFVYLFHLYYDNDQLFADRDFEFKYEVIPEKFVAETYNTQFPFRGEIINIKNEKVSEFSFDSRRGDPYFLKGKISVKAPYAPDGQKAVFYDARGRQLLTVFVEKSSFCNDDSICDPEKGEDEKSCPNDCKLPVADDQQPTTGGGFGSVIMWSLVSAAGVVGGWYGWKKYKEIKKPRRQEVRESIPTPTPSRDVGAESSALENQEINKDGFANKLR